MPVGRTHPAAIRVYPAVDHVHPVSLGGAWADPQNLVSACVPCNELKSDKLGWARGTFSNDGWNGLVEYYRALAERRAPIRRYHLDWLRALGT
ncbi:MAG: HNH endonuclease [Candidatus Eremiobacteraeota bacterium]|nr:HNH endonuclease [Candidatus Eremiobacteraeota bacterium]